MDGTARLFPRIALALLPLSAANLACGGEAPVPTTPVQPPTAERAPSDSPPTAPMAGARVVGSTAVAEPSEAAWPFSVFSTEDRNAQLERLKKNPGPITSNWVPPGKSERYGHAEGLIGAPADAVRTKLRDFASYKDLAGPKFKSVKVVEKQGQNTDVYFQLPIMRGMITLWYVTRFPPARQAGGGDVLEGTFVKGNIKNMHIAFTVRPGTEDKNSVLTCDLILRPNVPAPQSALDEELRDACGDAIRSLRKTIAVAP